jgi:hypothetical protein
MPADAQLRAARLRAVHRGSTQVALVDAKLRLARARGQGCMVLDLDVVELLVGLSKLVIDIVDEDSKPDGGGEQVGRCASAPGEERAPSAPVAAAAGEETVAIADVFGKAASR